MNDGYHRTYTDFAEEGVAILHLTSHDGPRMMKAPDPEDEIAPGVWFEYDAAGVLSSIKVERVHAVQTYEKQTTAVK
jgi:hypothetical protein